jgi:hypothetical protein
MLEGVQGTLIGFQIPERSGVLPSPIFGAGAVRFRRSVRAPRHAWRLYVLPLGGQGQCCKRRLPRTHSPLSGVPAYDSPERDYTSRAAGLDPPAMPPSHAKWVAARHASVGRPSDTAKLRAPWDRPARIPLSSGQRKCLLK